MAERPAAMYRKGRNPVPHYAPDELLYMRVHPDHINNEGRPIPTAFRLPNQSVNRGKYSEPGWVLIPSWLEWGILSFEKQDVPAELHSQSVEYRFAVEHHPLEYNFSHSEIRAYRKNESKFKENLNVAKAVRQQFKMRLFERATTLKFPTGSGHQ